MAPARSNFSRGPRQKRGPRRELMDIVLMFRVKTVFRAA